MRASEESTTETEEPVADERLVSFWPHTLESLSRRSLSRVVVVSQSLRDSGNDLRECLSQENARLGVSIESGSSSWA